MTLLVACAPPPPPQPPIMPAALSPVTTERNKAKDFARVFCSTLPHFKTPDGKTWGDCAKYLAADEPPQPQQELTTPYRFLVVSGLGGDCLRDDVRAFGAGLAHLKDAHQIPIEYFSVAPFGASGENGESIARHIDDTFAADARKSVLIGYDKGAVDLLEALRVLSAPTTKVAALVTVAGSIGGTWLPDQVRARMTPGQPWMAPGCPANMADGAYSLSRDVRQRFLRENPTPVPAYSLVAISGADDVSAVFKTSAKRLDVYGPEHDGQLVAWEAVVPGAKYLGAARADHWAVALPFDLAPTRIKAIDHNRYPREALLEAIVRYVSADLPAPTSAPR